MGPRIGKSQSHDATGTGERARAGRGGHRDGRGERISARSYLRDTTDTTIKAVTFEDSAALVGLVLAALGLLLEQLTGDPLWDGLSAILIGVLLVAAKVDFADDATVADIERAADEAERRLVARHPGVRYVFLDPTRGDERARVRAPEADDVPD